jgi:hypothetical protein
VESGDANATMLESIGAYQDVGWLQKCHLFPGATGPETRVDQVNTTEQGGGDLHWARLMMVGVDSKPGVCIATRREKYLMMVQFLLL